MPIHPICFFRYLILVLTPYICYENYFYISGNTTVSAQPSSSPSAPVTAMTGDTCTGRPGIIIHYVEGFLYPPEIAKKMAVYQLRIYQKTAL
jgi:hypothetical protein